MKSSLHRIAGCALLAAVLATPTLVRAQASTNTPAAAPKATGPNRFYGPVSKVDTNKLTFTVGDQTFTVAGESQLTDKDGNQATLTEAVVGQPARGSYTKKDDGTMTVTKVRFGKKSGGKAGGKGGGKKKQDSAAQPQSQ